MDSRVLEAARAAFPQGPARIILGAVMHSGECVPEPIASIPLSMLNRHGLIAGATGTGKTKSLQLTAERTQPFVVRMVPPSSRMGPLTDAELQQRIAASEQVQHYAQDLDRPSAREMLAQRVAPPAAQPQAPPPPPPPQPGQYQFERQQAEAAAAPPPLYEYQRAQQPPAQPRGRAAKEPPTIIETVLKSSTTRAVATQLVRSAMGVLFGGSSRRRRGGLW
jgi:hypothetical protein